MSEKPEGGFDWLVGRRCDIQRLLLGLHNLGARTKFDSLKAERAAFEILVGASFALWRAVFLIDPERSGDAVCLNGAEFLRLLVRDNMIAYVQERNTRVWSSGYYLNDAYFRLRLLNEFRVFHKWSVPAAESALVTRYFSELVRDHGVETSLKNRWVEAFDAIEWELRDLEARCSSPGAP